jgi:hypothetical protein
VGHLRRGEKPITERGLARLLGPLGMHLDRHHETPTGRARVRVAPRTLLTDDDRAFLREHRDEACAIVGYYTSIIGSDVS